MKQVSSRVNESVGKHGLFAHKAVTDLPIANGVIKRIDEKAEPDTQEKEIFLEKKLKSSESVPGCSRQIEDRQDILQRWLDETYSRMLFLSKNGNSVSFASFVSSFKGKKVQREESEKNTLEFLLALDDFFSSSPPLLLPIHFFIKTLLKKYRLLINSYRVASANLSCFKDINNQSREIKEKLIQEIEVLKKEKEALLNQQKELNAKHDELLPQLKSLTNDLEKFRIERSRNFNDEIDLNKKHLESCKNELSKISEEIKGELLFPEQQLEVNIRIKSRNIGNLILELDLLQEMLKNVDKFGLSNIVQQKKELEQNEEKLTVEINNLDLKTICMKQLESNSSDDLFSEKEKIEADLQKGRRKLDKIETLMRGLANLTPTDDSCEINVLIAKIHSNLRLALDKKTLAEKQEKLNASYRIFEKELVKLEKALDKAGSPSNKAEISLESKLEEHSETLLASEKAKLVDTISKLKGQIELNKELLDSAREEYNRNQGELITLLDVKGQALVALIKQLLKEKKEECSERVAELTKEKEELELFNKKHKLDKQKSELEEKLCKIEKDKSVWNLLADGELIQKLECLEKLQKILDESRKKLEKLEKTLGILEKKFAELKEKSAKLLESSGKDINKCKVDINKCKTNLKKQKEICQAQEDAEADYREQIKHIVNEKIKHNHLELQQNEKNLRFNSCDVRRLTVQIGWQEAKEHVKEAKDLLLQTVAESFEDNNTSEQPENLFFNSFTAVLRGLKEQVDETEWNTRGWGFFCKKAPDGIQQIRLLLNKIFNDLALNSGGFRHYEQNLFMLGCFSDIYRLIKQKNSSKKRLRSSEVKRFYQSVEQSLELLYEELNTTIDPDWFRVLVNSTEVSEQTFDSLSNNLFKESVSELNEDGIQSTRQGQYCESDVQSRCPAIGAR